MLSKPSRQTNRCYVNTSLPSHSIWLLCLTNSRGHKPDSLQLGMPNHRTTTLSSRRSQLTLGTKEVATLVDKGADSSKAKVGDAARTGAGVTVEAEPDDKVEASQHLRIMSHRDEDSGEILWQVKLTAPIRSNYTTIGMCVTHAD